LSSGGTNKNHSIPKKRERKSTERCFQQASKDYEESFFLEESKCNSTKG
jgi:hypothetical protein